MRRVEGQCCESVTKGSYSGTSQSMGALEHIAGAERSAADSRKKASREQLRLASPYVILFAPTKTNSSSAIAS